MSIILKPRHSLQLQVAALMTVLTLLAVFSMMSSLWIARAVQGETAAVNISGSLRMQCYKIATQLLSAPEIEPDRHWQMMQGLVQAFESRLKGQTLAAILPNDDNHKVRHAYNRVLKQWQKNIRPLLNIYIEGIIPPAKKPGATPENWGMISNQSVAGLRHQYLMRTPEFVALINQFVKVLEEDTVNKIEQLRRWQWTAFFLTVGTVLFALWFVRRNIITPLKTLLLCAKAAKKGDFSQRTPYTGQDELGHLGSSLNDMAQALSKLYADLEQRVQAKTADLEHSNRSLEILYRTVNRLSTTSFPHSTYQDMLEDIAALAQTGPANICLTNTIEDKAFKVASTRKANDCLEVCKGTECGKCFGDHSPHSFEQPAENCATHEVLSIPIKDRQQHHGVLLVEAKDKTGFADWQRKMLEAVANHIAIAISMSNRHAEQSRLALLEERGVIARELHDSLAQSLSYAKIQVSRLNSALEKADDKDSGELVSEVKPINDELREGLNRAYRELRELLTTFRLTMEDHDLNRTIQDTVAEFSQRSIIKISFVSDCPNGSLDPNEEIHLLQIIRESLSNIIQHSHAKKAQLFLIRNTNGKTELRIEDNGVGMAKSKVDEERQHYGMVIMRERALNLGGDLHIDSNHEGTTLTLTFWPTSSAQKASSLKKQQEQELAKTPEAVTI